MKYLPFILFTVMTNAAAQLMLKQGMMSLGAISFAGTLPTLFLMLPDGVVADRLPKRKLMIVTQTSMMFCALAIPASAANQANGEVVFGSTRRCQL